MLVLLVIGAAGLHVYHSGKSNGAFTASSNEVNLGNANSLDPITKGLALSNGQCSDTGTQALTHAPMNPSDISTIVSMGDTTGPHVPPGYLCHCQSLKRRLEK